MTPWTVAHQVTPWTAHLCPWDSPGKNTGVGSHFLLQGILPTQRSNPHLLHLQHWQADSLPLSHLKSPLLLRHFLKKKIYVFTWLFWVLVAACRIFSHSMLTLSWGMWDLVPWPGITPRPPALGLRGLSHWTPREVPPKSLSIFTHKFSVSFGYWKPLKCHPWRREWQSTPVFLPGEFHGQRSPAEHSPWSTELDTTEWLTLSLKCHQIQTLHRRAKLTDLEGWTVGVFPPVSVTGNLRWHELNSGSCQGTEFPPLSSPHISLHAQIPANPFAPW